eukprot:gene10706-biopygen5244
MKRKNRGHRWSRPAFAAAPPPLPPSIRRPRGDGRTQQRTVINSGAAFSSQTLHD